MKQDDNAYRADFLCHFGDSSNYAADGEGIPEMLQRKAKEQKEEEAELSKKLLEGKI